MLEAGDYVRDSARLHLGDVEDAAFADERARLCAPERGERAALEVHAVRAGLADDLVSLARERYAR